MNEVTLNPKGPAIQLFIQRAVAEQLSESPVRYAFDDGWPVHLSELEAQEVLEAVRNYGPMFYNIHGKEHKEIAVKTVMTAIPHDSTL